MIENPSEKDEIYLANVAKIGDSIENIQYIEDVLSKEEHKVLLEYAKNTESWEKQPWLVYSVTSGLLPENVRETLKKIFEMIYKKSTDFYGVDLDPLKIPALYIVRFDEGFFLPIHTDTMSAESNHIASVYYINDDYEGGEICFPHHNLKIKPKANSMIFFPGNENYNHEVLKVVGKPRYSAAMWFQFTGSTFNKNSEWYG